ncbi:hypothetical protein JW905_12400 [bacterium]|nr:hypothetical protein [candidate division CSSED10-310 bacterium]
MNGTERNKRKGSGGSRTRPCFIADRTVVRLGKWLRLLGYDVVIAKAVGSPDAVQEFRLLKDEKRIFLTRDTRLHRRLDQAGAAVLLIASDHVACQLDQVVTSCALPQAQPVLRRCSHCNRPLSIVSDKEEVRAMVPEYIFSNQPVFHRCDCCGRIYWHGSHVLRMTAWLSDQRDGD